MLVPGPDMLPKSHFRPLSRPRENGFVDRTQNFLVASSMKSVHGLAKKGTWPIPRDQPAIWTHAVRAGKRSCRRLGHAAAKKRGGGGDSRLFCRADRSRWRRQKPEGSSKAARNRLRSTQGNRRRQGRDGACDTLLIRRSSEFIKTFGTSSLKQAIRGAHAPA